MQKRTLSVLSTAAMATVLATALTSTAFAKTTDILVKDASGKLYQYSYEDLKASLMGDKVLFNEFKTRSAVAYKDDKAGYVDFSYLRDLYMNSDKKTFNLNATTEAAPATNVLNVTDAVTTRVVDANGAVVDGTVINNNADVKVDSVSAINNTTLKVNFTAPVADTSKVAFTVTLAGANVSVTPTWNDAKTEASLTKSSNLISGTYTVAVKNDTTDLGSSTVTVTDQKVAKIAITSDKLGIVQAASNTYDIYLTYKVYDQYGVDITNSALANNLVVQSGFGNFSAKNGVAKLNTAQNLLTYSNIVITSYDSASGTSTSATLGVTTGMGTLSDIQLGTALTNADGKVLTAGDSTTVFYLPFTATDISGNATSDYNLIKNGLILGASDTLNSSSPYVTASLVQDPNDSNKAAIQVKDDGSNISLDMPVVITAMTKTGKTSQFNVTLKKQGSLDSFTLGVPTDTVASGDSATIPFTAYDQNGKQLTKFSDLNTYVTLSNATLVKNVDGTASVKSVAVTNSGTQSVPEVITATTPTGKFSTITLNVQKAATADSLAVDSSAETSLMQIGASQVIDFGYDNGGLSVKDSYGRSVDMTTVGKNTYQVSVSSSDPTIVRATGTASCGQNEITISAVAPGTATLTFSLIDTAHPATVIDTKTLTFSTVSNSDIKGYTIDAVSSPLYTSAAVGDTWSTAISRAKDYYANPYVYGTTSSGSKVLLAGSRIISANVDSSNFQVTYGTSYDSVKVMANKFSDPAKTGATANLTVTINGVDNNVYSVTTPITSTTAAPVASTVGTYVDTSVAGVSVSDNIVTIDLNQTAANGFVTGNYITRNDISAGTVTTRSAIYMYAKDQYGKKAMPLSTINMASTSTVSPTGFSVAPNGQITVNAANINNNDYADITIVSTNGLLTTERIKFVK